MEYHIVFFVILPLVLALFIVPAVGTLQDKVLASKCLHRRVFSLKLAYDHLYEKRLSASRAKIILFFVSLEVALLWYMLIN